MLFRSAKAVLSGIEQENTAEHPLQTPSKPESSIKKSKKKKSRDAGQLELFAAPDRTLIKMLERADISNMTPLDALLFLNDLKKKALN